MATGNMQFGASNDAKNSETELQSTATDTLLVSNSGTRSAVYGESTGDAGVFGNAQVKGGKSGSGVYGYSNFGDGVTGSSNQGVGVFGSCSGPGTGVMGVTATNAPAVSGVARQGGGSAGAFSGDVNVAGKLNVTGTVAAADAYVNGNANVNGGVNVKDKVIIGDPATGSGGGLFTNSISPQLVEIDINGPVFVHGELDCDELLSPLKLFRIDHPLDPANKYLNHFSVESPEMKTVYDGTVVLNADGEAVVELPDWFEVLNGEFRYQLTPIGAPAPSLHIAERISNRRFSIGGGEEGLEVCWHVTGIRRDPVARSNGIVVEQEKPAKEQGYYLHPDLYGEPEERGIAWARRQKTEEQMRTESQLVGLRDEYARRAEELKRQMEELERVAKEHSDRAEQFRR